MLSAAIWIEIAIRIKKYNGLITHLEKKTEWKRPLGWKKLLPTMAIINTGYGA